MRRNVFGLMAASAMLVLLAADWATAQKPASGASSDGEALLEDHFESLDPGWGEESASVKASNGMFSLICGDNQYWMREYQGDVFNDANVSIDCCLDSGPDGSYGGLMFWAAGYNDYYLLTYDTTGDAAVMHVVKDRRTTYPMSWRHADSVKKDRKECNTLRVETRGKNATVFINGKKIATVKGQPPNGGSYVGVYASSAVGGGATWQFKNLKITAPAK